MTEKKLSTRVMRRKTGTETKRQTEEERVAAVRREIEAARKRTGARNIIILDATEEDAEWAHGKKKDR